MQPISNLIRSNSRVTDQQTTHSTGLSRKAKIGLAATTVMGATMGMSYLLQSAQQPQSSPDCWLGVWCQQPSTPTDYTGTGIITGLFVGAVTATLGYFSGFCQNARPSEGKLPPKTANKEPKVNNLENNFALLIHSENIEEKDYEKINEFILDLEEKSKLDNFSIDKYKVSIVHITSFFYGKLRNDPAHEEALENFLILMLDIDPDKAFSIACSCAFKLRTDNQGNTFLKEIIDRTINDPVYFNLRKKAMNHSELEIHIKDYKQDQLDYYKHAMTNYLENPHSVHDISDIFDFQNIKDIGKTARSFPDERELNSFYQELLTLVTDFAKNLILFEIESENIKEGIKTLYDHLNEMSPDKANEIATTLNNKKNGSQKSNNNENLFDENAYSPDLANSCNQIIEGLWNDFKEKEKTNYLIEYMNITFPKNCTKSDEFFQKRVLSLKDQFSVVEFYGDEFCKKQLELFEFCLIDNNMFELREGNNAIIFAAYQDLHQKSGPTQRKLLGYFEMVQNAYARASIVQPLHVEDELPKQDALELFDLYLNVAFCARNYEINGEPQANPTFQGVSKYEIMESLLNKCKKFEILTPLYDKFFNLIKDESSEEWTEWKVVVANLTSGESPENPTIKIPLLEANGKS